MTFTRAGRLYGVVVGLDGSAYVAEWRDELEQRHGTPHWHVLGRFLASTSP